MTAHKQMKKETQKYCIIYANNVDQNCSAGPSVQPEQDLP